MSEAKHSSARSATAFVSGLVFIAASVAVWSQTDLRGGEAVFGIWLGLGCLAWGLVWMAFGGSDRASQTTTQAMAAVAAAMAVMVGTGYLAWDQAGLYLLEALAVAAIAFWLFSRDDRMNGRPDSDESAANRSTPAFVVGLLFIAAMLVTWYQTDVPRDEVFWGLCLGAGCWAWAIAWRLLSKSTEIDRVVAQAATLVAIVMASMVSVDYLTWDQAGLYLLEAMAVVAVIFGLAHWLDQPGQEVEAEAEAEAEALAPAADTS